MKTSPILGLPIEQGSDTRRDFPSRVDEPRTQQLETYTVPRFANVAARDQKIPTPTNGQLCVTTDTYTYWYYRAGSWKAIGAAPPLSIDLGSIQITAASHVVGLDGNGYGVIPFGQPFRMECQGVILGNGDGIANVIYAVVWAQMTAAQFTMHARNNAGANITGTHRANYIAWGR